MQFSDPTCLKAKYSKAINAYMGTLQTWRDGCQVEHPDDRWERAAGGPGPQLGWLGRPEDMLLRQGRMPWL